jgi:Na+/proline symporter
MEQIARASADITLRVAKLAALFCSLLAAAYAALQIQPSAVMGLLLTSAPAIVVILWLQKDARRTGVGGSGLGLFLWLACRL